MSNYLKGSFTTAQLKILAEKKKRIYKWNDEDIVKGLLLRSISTRAYQFIRLQNFLPLPSLSTLKNWVRHFRCEPGVQDDVLKILKNKIESESSPLSKLAAISFDEMEISRCYEYDQSSDRVLGPHKKLQLVMARGICQNWKQPVFFNFDQPMKLDLLFRIVISLETNGLQIWAVNFDLGNVGLLGELGVSTEKPFFLNPFDPCRPIFVFPDAPHMLKLLQNHLLDQGVVLEDGTEVTKEDLEEILLVDKAELKICHKLTQNHLDVRGSARQNVRLAAQVLSHTTATAMSSLFEGREKKAQFFEIVNNWFDVMNSRLEKDCNKLKCAFGIHFEDQVDALNSMLKMTEKMRIKKRKGLLPFQKGIIIGIRSLIGLFEKLNETFEVRYLRTVCKNQDIVENFFSRIRALGITHTHPGPVAAKNRIRLLMLGREADIIVKTSAVKMDEFSSPSSKESSFLVMPKVKKLNITGD